jgi:beta-galactosidase
MCHFVNGVATVDLWVFSEAPLVELFVNGVSLGVQDMPQYSHVSWSVPYESGNIEAVAYNSEGVELTREFIVTTGEAHALQASIKDDVGSEGISDDGSDVAFIQVKVVDADGNVVPTASNEITFTIDVETSAFIAGTGNGDPADHTNDKSATRPAYHGLVLGIVQAVNGDVSEVVVQVSAQGLLSDSITIPIKATTFPVQRL